jgi:uncharacterized membrane protein YccC
MNPPGRPLATFAVGFLLLDAMLLVWVGLDLERPGFLWGGVGCAGAAAAVVLVWRRYRYLLEDLDERRREMKADAESLRQLLRAQHYHN